MSIKENWDKVLEKVRTAAEESGRTLEDITVIAVTKTRTADEINEVISSGATDIGENKPQEVRDKFHDVKDGVKWHLIGHLQTNKIKYIIDKVCLIHSVDSIHLMDEIDKQAKKHSLIMPILIQVNISGEETKQGVSRQELPQLLEHAGTLSNIRVEGLMTIMPKVENNITNSLHFDNIRQLFVDISCKKYDNVTMKHLSMGMSGDYEEAILHGATMVRVGTAIFGARDYSKT
ncbi:MAG: YggS family pyridoxal phosphate-dependent enzyme [Clostridia bacterium]|nr:YggS family pyridoxal phosphate-dependent enzyme [Clostridia bacterium]